MEAGYSILIRLSWPLDLTISGIQFNSIQIKSTQLFIFHYHPFIQSRILYSLLFSSIRALFLGPLSLKESNEGSKGTKTSIEISSDIPYHVFGWFMNYIYEDTITFPVSCCSNILIYSFIPSFCIQLTYLYLYLYLYLYFHIYLSPIRTIHQYIFVYLLTLWILSSSLASYSTSIALTLRHSAQPLTLPEFSQRVTSFVRW